MNFLNRSKVKMYYKRHFGEDCTDFDHIYGMLESMDNSVLSLDKDKLSEHGKYYAKTTAKEIRMTYAEKDLIELTVHQADFIALMGVIITGNAIKMLGGL
jgi:hypothetical protein